MGQFTGYADRRGDKINVGDFVTDATNDIYEVVKTKGNFYLKDTEIDYEMELDEMAAFVITCEKPPHYEQHGYWD